MRTFTKEELSLIIEKHKKWIRGEEYGERANLRSANLSSANLRYAIGESNFVKSMQIEKYYISYTSNKLNIGCQAHTIKEWQELSDEAITEMGGGALEWWKIWKPIIMQIIKLSPAKEPGQKDDR